jgi:hypothetical protein
MRPRILAAALTAGVVLGCSPLGPQKDLTQFYVLTSLAEEEPPQGMRPAGDLSFGVGPVDFAAYLDRPQIVTRMSENQVEFSDVGRWAGPLRRSLARAVAENLAMLLETTRISEYPWFETERPDFAVRMHVIRFEWNAAGYAELLVGWAVVDRVGEEREWAVNRFTQPADAASADARIAALSRTLQQFSESIADEIRRLEAARPAVEQEAEK